MAVSVKSILRNALWTFDTFFFRNECLQCKAALHQNEEALCEQCWKLVRQAPSQDVLTRSVHSTMERVGSEMSIDSVISFALFIETGALQKIIHEVKYHDAPSFSKILATKLGDRIRNDVSTIQDTVLTFVPMYPARRRERGFNQAEELARRLGDTMNLPSQSLLTRVRNTTTQTALSAENRKRNVRKAFALRANADVRDKNIIVVDDVITSGATMNECALVLKDAGASQVIAVSVGIVL